MSAPTLTTQACTAVAQTTCTGNGTLTNKGGADFLSRRGFCYVAGVTGNPTVANSVVYEDGTFSNGAYALNIGSLTAATSYRVAAYAPNGPDVGYGNTVQLSTLLQASGAISMDNVNGRLAIASGTQISLNDAAVRALFVKASGAIDLQDGYGK